jgi:hypothetical protein
VSLIETGLEIDGLGKPAIYFTSERNLIERSGSVQLSTLLEETLDKTGGKTRNEAEVIKPEAGLNIAFCEETLHLLDHIAVGITSTKIIEALLDYLLSITSIRSYEERYDVGIVTMSETVDDVEAYAIDGVTSTVFALYSFDDAGIVEFADILMYAIAVDVMDAGDDIHAGINLSGTRALIGKGSRYGRRSDLENENHREVKSELITEGESDRKILTLAHVSVLDSHDFLLCSCVSDPIYNDGAFRFGRVVYMKVDLRSRFSLTIPD